jgi:hypothetical protein
MGSASLNVIGQRYVVTDKLPFIPIILPKAELPNINQHFKG